MLPREQHACPRPRAHLAPTRCQRMGHHTASNAAYLQVIYMFSVQPEAFLAGPSGGGEHALPRVLVVPRKVHHHLATAAATATNTPAQGPMP